MNKKGVISQGIVCPIFREGDNLVDMVTEAVLKQVEDIQDKDVIGLTESIVARTAGLYVTVDQIAEDIVKKFGKDAVIFLDSPIYSRNRFAMILKGIARAAKKIVINMPPFDEVGNPRGVNPFTGVDIEKYYKELCESEGCECETFHDDNEHLLHTSFDNRIDCRLHVPKNAHSGTNWYLLGDICSDYNQDFGLLGSNKASEERLKLFPTKSLSDDTCNAIKAKIKEITGKNVIVLTYGDGAFKDPMAGIWEFADPITVPGSTDHELMLSTPNEIKLKNVIDTTSSDSDVNEIIEKKDKDLKGQMKSMGTTPRRFMDLLASLMDLTSGSGDRATPVVVVRNYFN